MNPHIKFGMLIAASSLFGILCSASAQADGIGVAWVGTSGMAKRVLAGFETRMAALAPDWTIEVNGELADMAALSNSYQDFANRYGGAVILRSNGAKWLAANQPSKPTFIGAANHPPSLGVVKDVEKPEGNITGVTYYLDPLTVLETFTGVKELDSALFIHQEGHPGTAIDRAGYGRACEEMFMSCTFVTTPDSSGVAQAIADNSGFDGIIIGNQAPLFDDRAHFKKALKAAGKTPILGLNSNVPKMGGLAALAADDRKLGAMLADKVSAVMRNGATIAATPVGTDDLPTLFLNSTTQARLQLSIPKQMVEAATIIK